MKKIVFTGGGTAGHIYPNLAIALEMNSFERHYIGSSGMEKEILKGYPALHFHEIDCVKFDRNYLFKNFKIPFKLLASIRQAKKILMEIEPCVVFSKGGYVALPVAIAAKKLNIPLITHESDLTLGLANKIISHYANFVCTTFEKTAEKGGKFIYTGQPLRKQIFEGNKDRVLSKLGYPQKKILLFVGGSLGAQRINSLLKDPTYLTSKYEIIHSVGKKNFASISKKEGYHPFPYLDPIADYYMASDIVITRAGSGVINELLALKKPMLMLPLSKASSRGDQIENAKLFTSLGYGEMILDEQLNEDNLAKMIEKMQKNLDFYKKNLQNAPKNDAVKKIIDLIEQFC